MLTQHLALTVEKDGLIDPADLTRIAAALQKQVTRDFAPIWKTSATVSAFTRLKDVPLGYWPVIVVADVKDAAGYHEDQNGQPFALVEAGPSWSLTASHETLEMIADPFGKRLVAGQSPDPKKGRVQFLVEVCDPSEDEAFSYTVNGVRVSDFYTPNFFDPVASPGVRYSFTGAIDKPRKVLRGGYLSWHDPRTNHWYQETYFGSKPEIRDLGRFDAKFRNFRAFTDYHTPQTQDLARLGDKSAMFKAAAQSFSESEAATNSQAESWLQDIKKLRANGGQG